MISDPKIAIIGCGQIGSLLDENSEANYALSHAGAYQRLGVKISYLVDTNIKRLEECARIRGVDKIYVDYNDLFDNEKIDILSICASTSNRVSIFQRAVDANIPIIICEKPLAANLDEANTILKLLEESASNCIVNYSRRWDTDIKQIKTLIDSDDLGDIMSIEITYGKGVFNNAGHAFNLIDFFFSCDKEVLFASTIQDDRLNYDPTCNAFLSYKIKKKSFPVILRATDHRLYSLWEIDMIFSKGRIKLENSGLDKKIFNVQDSPVFKGYRSLNLEEELTEGYFHCMQNMVSETLEIFYNNKKKTSCNAIEAVKPMELADEICKVAQRP